MNGPNGPSPGIRSREMAVTPDRGWRSAHRWLAGAGLLLGLLLGSLATATGTETPQAVIRRTAEQVLQILQRRHPATPEEQAAIIEQIVLPHVDIQRGARLVLGKYWRRFRPGQRQRFISGFRQLIIRTYAGSLGDYHGEHIRYLPEHNRIRDDEALIRTQLVQPDGPPVAVDYHLHRRQGRWLVYDVSVEGVSLALNYRSTFAEQIRRQGIEGFLAHLDQVTLPAPVPGPNKR